MVYQIPVWKLKNFYLELTEVKNMYFLGPKVKNAICDEMPPLPHANHT